MLIAIPISIAEVAIAGPEHRGLAGGDALSAAVCAFAIAGLVEELGKFFVVRATMYRSPYFDEPMRGLIYSSAAALGFASIENLVYMVQAGAAVILVRGIECTLGHVFFASCWGYSLGAARRRADQGRRGGGALVALGLTAAIALHGLWDYGLMHTQGDSTDLDRFAGPSIAFPVGLIVFLALSRLADRSSPHRGRTAHPIVNCPVCERSHPLTARFCDGCGHRLDRASAAQFCGTCQAPIPSGAAFCESCGTRAERRAARTGG